jgi:hypothetical protein
LKRSFRDGKWRSIGIGIGVGRRILKTSDALWRENKIQTKDEIQTKVTDIGYHLSALCFMFHNGIVQLSISLSDVKTSEVHTY